MLVYDKLPELRKMRINLLSNSTNPYFQAKSIIINGQKLIPKSEYNGPILKLTKNDMRKISNLRASIANLELERLRLEEYYDAKFIGINKRDFFTEAFENIDYQIDILKDKIELIKASRLKKQNP